MSKAEGIAVKPREKMKNLVMLWILIGIWIAGLFLSDTFMKPNNIRNILMDTSIYGILALGQTMVMLVKEIDLSVGASLAFSPMCAVYLTNKILPAIQGGNNVIGGAGLIILFTLLVSTVVGLFNAFLIIRVKIPAIIATMGTMYVLNGITYMLFGGYSLYLTGLEGFNTVGTSSIGVFPLPFLIFAVITGIVLFFMKKTGFGNKIYAIGGNIRAAEYSGIRTGIWKAAAFAFGGICVGIAALLYCSRMESIETVQGSGYEMTTIAIAVIGGTTMDGGRGKIENTFLASIILSSILNLMSLKGLVSWYQTIFIGVIIVFAAVRHAYLYRRADQAVNGQGVE